jgi:hypothetical protein
MEKAMRSTVLLKLFGVALAALQFTAFAQSENPADNQQFMQKTFAELAEYVDAKCGDFKVPLRFDETGFDFSKNPTLGTPTAKDRATAGVYAIASVCEMGDAPSNRMKSKFNAIQVRPGSANVARLNGKTLDITYNPRSTEPFGRLREQYVGQMNKF